MSRVTITSETRGIWPFCSTAYSVRLDGEVKTVWGNDFAAMIAADRLRIEIGERL